MKKHSVVPNVASLLLRRSPSSVKVNSEWSVPSYRRTSTLTDFLLMIHLNDWFASPSFSKRLLRKGVCLCGPLNEGRGDDLGGHGGTASRRQWTKGGWGKKTPRTGYFGEEDWEGGGKPISPYVYIYIYIDTHTHTIVNVSIWQLFSTEDVKWRS
jgi:hypothetical protein